MSFFLLVRCTGSPYPNGFVWCKQLAPHLPIVKLQCTFTFTPSKLIANGGCRYDVNVTFFLISTV